MDDRATLGVEARIARALRDTQERSVQVVQLFRYDDSGSASGFYAHSGVLCGEISLSTWYQAIRSQGNPTGQQPGPDKDRAGIETPVGFDYTGADCGGSMK